MQIVVTLNPLNRSLLNKMCLQTQNIRTVCVCIIFHYYKIILYYYRLSIDTKQTKTSQEKHISYHIFLKLILNQDNERSEEVSCISETILSANCTVKAK